MAVVVLYNTMEVWDIMSRNRVRYEGCDMGYVILQRGEYDRLAESTDISRYLVA